MPGTRSRGDEIRQFLLDAIAFRRRDIPTRAAHNFDVTRQAIGKHLRRLIQEGVITQTGKTRARNYELTILSSWRQRFDLNGALAEDVVWRQEIEPKLTDLGTNVTDIWHIGFTEMLNNAIDHSSGQHVYVAIERTSINTVIRISDNGVGIFRKIQGALGLLDERHAVLELAKGKFTTDPSRHSGEGIFFTSRMFDDFYILSGGVYFDHQAGEEEDWILERREVSEGTSVGMMLSNYTTRSSGAVYAKYSTDGNYGFTKTVVPVDLARYGNENLVSRSQAKRLLSRVDLFKRVLFDFTGVPCIGQAFADEIFRVFPQHHPSTTVRAINTNHAVQGMIDHVKGSGGLAVAAEDDK